MIETHIINALLQNHLKGEAFYAFITFINGLVAPTFLFCAGFAFAVSSHRRWNDFTAFQLPARKYAMRLLFILMVGYSLHMPIYSFKRMLHTADSAIWTSFFMVDILQVIAVSLLFLLLFSILLRKEQYLFSAVLVITLFIIFISPLVNTVDLPSFPVWLRGYISAKFLSQFTLFPWASFLLAGYLLGYGYMHSLRLDLRKIIRRSVWISTAIIFGSIISNYLPINIYPGNSFWNSPQFVFLRLGFIVILGSLLWYMENKSPQGQQTPSSAPASLVLQFGKESLLVYTVHLLIVYGRDYSWGFINIFGDNLSYLQCLGLFILLTTGMYILAYIWSWLKSWNIRSAKVIQYAIVIIFLTKFFLNE